MSNVIEFPTSKVNKPTLDNTSGDRLLIRFVDCCDIPNQVDRIAAFNQLRVAIFDYVYLGYFQD